MFRERMKGSGSRRLEVTLDLQAAEDLSVLMGSQETASQAVRKALRKSAAQE